MVTPCKYNYFKYTGCPRRCVFAWISLLLVEIKSWWNKEISTEFKLIYAIFSKEIIVRSHLKKTEKNHFKNLL